MFPMELARLHQNLDKPIVADRAAEAEFLRTAGMLSALAASVLIISSVWLAEIPSRHAAALSPGVAVVPASDLLDVPAWERTALTLSVEPSLLDQNGGGKMPGPHLGSHDEPEGLQIGLADSRSVGNNALDAQSIDARVADWMVTGLSEGGGHANP